MLATLSLSFAWAPWPLIAPRADECPAVTTGGSANFNLTAYGRKSWYIQAQQVESYQPLDSLYCVTATYDLDGATVPFFRGMRTPDGVQIVEPAERAFLAKVAVLLQSEVYVPRERPPILRGEVDRLVAGAEGLPQFRLSRAAPAQPAEELVEAPI